jgi:hypothetical protein
MSHDLRHNNNVSIHKLGRQPFDFLTPLQHQSNEFQISDFKFQDLNLTLWNLESLEFGI